MRAIFSGVAAGVLALLLSGCSASGVAAHADADGFASCLEGAGLSLDGADDWSENEEREFLSQPEALECVLSEVPAEERPDLLGRAFPDDGDTEDVDREVRGAKTEALVAFARDHASADRDALVDDVVTLMTAFGWTFEEGEVDPWVGSRLQVALAWLEARGEAPQYETWVKRQGRAGPDARIDFIQEQESPGDGRPASDLYLEIQELVELMYTALGMDSRGYFLPRD